MYEYKVGRGADRLMMIRREETVTIESLKNCIQMVAEEYPIKKVASFRFQGRKVRIGRQRCGLDYGVFKACFIAYIIHAQVKA